jgi:hypothetical protein
MKYTDEEIEKCIKILTMKAFDAWSLEVFRALFLKDQRRMFRKLVKREFEASPLGAANRNQPESSEIPANSD